MKTLRGFGDGENASRNGGYTLLELMLALTLAAMIMVAISMAIDLHLRVLESRRNHVERIQLARAVLGMVATDLRSTVQQSTTDFSALAAMATESLASGAVDEALGESGSDGSSGESSAASGTGGSSTGGSSSSSSSGGSPPSGSGSSPDSRSGSSSGSSSTGGTAPSGGTGTSGGTGGGTSSGTGTAGTGGDASGATEGAESESTASEDIASTETVPPVPGLYGNQYELQIDISRLPRVDELQRMNSNSLTNTLQDIPSDVKTVAYYCVGNGQVNSTGVVNPRTGKTETGLVRRVMDRAVTLYAADSGNLQGLQQAAEVIAPEVASIEFQYYDGTEWLSEWDSDEMCGLPTAVRITLLLAERAEADGTSPAIGSQVPTMATATGDQIYSLMVRLPTAKPATTSTEDESGMESLGL